MQQLAISSESEPLLEPERTETRHAWAGVLRAVRIESASAYELGGRRVEPGRAPPPAWPGQVSHAEPLVDRLAADLYQFAYATRIDGPRPETDDAFDEASASALSAALSAANDTTAGWDDGWIVQGTTTNGGVWARKGDRVRVLLPGEFHVPGARGALPSAGAAASAWVERESTTMQPGFWFAFGAELGDAEDEQGLLRFYFNVRHGDDAPPLVRAITSRLNRFAIPFRLKCPVHPVAYRRIDTMVLYIARRHFRITSWLLADVHDALRDRLDAEVPLLTLRLRHGLGLAEDPGGGESFGTHRCRLLAEGLWEAHDAGASSDAARDEHVVAVFRRSGLDPDRPWLGPRSRGDYDFPRATESA